MLTRHKGSVLLSMLLTWMLSACIVVVILMAPALMQKQHGISAALSLQANCLATVMLLVGCIIAGWLVDWIGAAKTLTGGSLLLAVCSWHFFASQTPDANGLFFNYGLAGLSVGVVGVVPFLMVRAFPAAVRFTGISFSYNVAYAIFGGLTPIFVTLILRLTPLAPAWYVVALALTGLFIGLWLHNAGRQGALASETRL